MTPPDPIQPALDPVRGAFGGVDYTKIVATIGPASEGRIGALIDAGMNVARINFSHGTLEEQRKRIGTIRAEARSRMMAVGILADLQGPKMRLGCFEGGGMGLEKGQQVEIREGGGKAPLGSVLFNFGGFVDCLKAGHRLLLADGQVCLEVESVGQGVVTARVTRSGQLADRKGVHMPDSEIEYELPTAEDRRHIEFCNEIGIDMLGISFVGAAAEIHEIRKLCPGALIVAKIERRQAILNLAEILAAADGIMVARGDLGVELDLEQVPVQQKTMLHEALHAGRFTITATEMLESMIKSSRPTRAEVADVANAVLDGSDAIMLSAETAVGAHPVEAVATMRRIARAVEASSRYHRMPRADWREAEPDAANAVAMAAVRVASALKISKIVCFTETGRTARLLTRYRPGAEIIALSPKESTVNQMTLLAGARPILFRREPSLEDMLYMASEMLVVRDLASYGETVVFVAGVPPGVSRSTNVLKLSKIGEEIRLH